MIAHALRPWASRVQQRQPDRVIGTERAYMRRWHVWRTAATSLYVHEFLASDDDRALHDHPWPSVSICLDGALIEHLAGGRIRHVSPGVVSFRSPWCAHRLELVSDTARTVFLTGPRVRSWGFHCPQGWRHWRDFTAGEHGESIGRGCD